MQISFEIQMILFSSHKMQEAAEINEKLIDLWKLIELLEKFAGLIDLRNHQQFSHTMRHISVMHALMLAKVFYLTTEWFDGRLFIVS